ncbi:hypothetical protein CYJ23_11370 [Actinomyces oris]|uniref:hypothetical protein n=1 Tax=Actinomyces oris TaxID=544580 RepID=UPI000C764966|nr:hypothetical protein [Actinomyces oris]PKY73710.1 hypothetical protein CYJ23_11370 [Actinomyces oris]
MNIFVNFIRICFWGFVFLVAFSITEDPSSPGLTTFHLLKAVAVASVAIIPLVLGKDVPVLGGICQFLLSWGWEPKVVYDIPKDKKDKWKRARRINRRQKEAWARADLRAATGRKDRNGEEEFETPRIVKIKDDSRGFVVVVELVVGVPVAKVEAAVDDLAVAFGYSRVKVESSADERRRVNLVFFLGAPIPAGRIGADWLE